MKRICLIVAILIVFSCFVPANVKAWDEGGSWSFKQTTDYSNISEEDFLNSMASDDSGNLFMPNNHTYNKTRQVYNYNISGKEAFLFDIRYAGKDGDLHKFHYKGGFYNQFDSKVHMKTWWNTSFRGNYSNSTTETNEKLHIEKIDIEFNGTIWAKKYTYENKSYVTERSWGIVRQYIHSEGYENLTLQKFGNNSKVVNISTLIDSEVDMNIVYTPPLPWLPVWEEGIKKTNFISVDAEYDGVVSGTVGLNVSGSPDVDDHYTDAIGDEIHEDIYKEFSISEKVLDGFVNTEGDNFTKPSPIIGSKVPAVSLSFVAISMINSQTDYFSPSSYTFMVDMLKTNHRYIFEEGEVFYGSIVHDGYSIRSMESGNDIYRVSPIFLYLLSGKKHIEQTSEEEVDKFLEDKEAYATGEGTEESDSGMNDLVLILFISTVTALIFVWLLLFRPKEEVPTKFQAPEGP